MDQHGETLVPPAHGQPHVQAFLAALDRRNHPFKPKPGDLSKTRCWTSIRA